MKEVIITVAQYAGVTPEELVKNRSRHELYRDLAIVLCRRCYGVEDRVLANTFCLTVATVRGANGYLVEALERKSDIRIKFDQICQSLGERPIAPHSSWVWPQQRVQAIWQALGDRVGLSSQELIDLRRRSGSMLPYRWLGFDMCLRLSEMNPWRLGRGLGVATPMYALKRLPLQFREDAELLRADQEISAALGLPPRAEWY